MNYPSFGYFWQAEGSPWISEWGGQAFPWVIFSHMLRDGGSRKLSFLNMLAQLFSSLGPGKTKRKVCVTSFTGTVSSNPVSHCSCCPFVSVLFSPCSFLLCAWSSHSHKFQTFPSTVLPFTSLNSPAV